MAETIILTSQNNHGISYSDDNGHTFTLSNITTGSFDKAIYNNNGIAVTRAIDKGNNNSVEGILYSEDGGATWIAAIEDGFFSPIVKLNNGMMYSSHLETGKTYYSENGKDWYVSSILLEEYLVGQFSVESEWQQNLAANRDTGRNLQAVFGCSTLQETCRLLQEKANAHDFVGLSPCGDYIDLPIVKFDGTDYLANNETQTLRFVVAGLNIYEGSGGYNDGVPNEPGIVFIEKNVLCQKRMDSAGNKPFYSTRTSCTELGTKFNAAVSDMENVLGVSLKTVKRWYDMEQVSSVWDEKQEKLFLPTEREVFGDTPWSADYRTYATSIIWPIFSKCPQSRIKYHQSNVGERRWWWTANKSSASGCYTTVGCYGNAASSGATTTSYSVVLAFSL